MSHRRHHHRKYALDCEQYDALIRRAEGRCERCARVLPRGGDIDHDHGLGWGAVRGLVCVRCNSLMGFQERGAKPMDELTVAYMERAWHLSSTPGLPISRQAPVRTFRVDDERWARWHAAAAVEGQTVSDFIRQAMDEYAAETSPRSQA